MSLVLNGAIVKTTDDTEGYGYGYGYAATVMWMVPNPSWKRLSQKKLTKTKKERCLVYSSPNTI